MFLGFYANLGNYLGFGDSKFVPNLDKTAFEKIVNVSKAVAKNPGKTYKVFLNNRKKGS